MSAAAGGAAATAAGARESENYTTIVSIDFGTAGCGFSIAFRPAGGVAEFKPEDAAVHMFAPGQSSEGSKTLTAVLLENKPGEKFLAYGPDARKRWAAACDDGRQKQFLYFERFKMHLAPSRRERDVFSMEIASAGHGTKKPLILPFVRVLEYTRQCALDQLRRNLGTAPDERRIGWVLTVPAIWDDEAKSFMREAAKQAGIIADRQSQQLLLALEPEGAALASIILAPTEVRRKMEQLGTRVLVMDCGGGTVDITVSEVKGSGPLQLGEILPPSGGAWGATYVDRNFETFVERLVGVSRFKAMDEVTRLGVLESWESTKHQYKPDRPDEDCRVDFTKVEAALREMDEDDDSEPVALADLVARYNARYGSDGATCSATRRGNIVLSPKLIESFFKPLVDTTVSHVKRLLADPAAEGVSYVVLVGGFADSQFLQKAVTEQFNRPGRTVIVPQKPGGAVVRGATWYGLYPNAFITSRKARYSYAVMVAEDYMPAVHPADVAVTNDSGERLAIVLQPLIVKGEDVEVNKRASIHVIPTYKEDSIIRCKLYRTNDVVARLTPGTPRTVLGEGVGRVPESACIATVEIDVGGRDIALDDKTCELEFSFGRTELTVRATADRTKAIRYASVKYGVGGM